MDWKGALKPTITKVLLFAVLMGGINYFLISSTVILDARILVGLPLGFWPVGGFFIATGQTPPTVEFSWVNFIADAVFWYLVAVGILALYQKVGKK